MGDSKRLLDTFVPGDVILVDWPHDGKLGSRETVLRPAIVIRTEKEHDRCIVALCYSDSVTNNVEVQAPFLRKPTVVRHDSVVTIPHSSELASRKIVYLGALEKKMFQYVSESAHVLSALKCIVEAAPHPNAPYAVLSNWPRHHAQAPKAVQKIVPRRRD